MTYVAQVAAIVYDPDNSVGSVALRDSAGGFPSVLKVSRTTESAITHATSPPFSPRPELASQTCASGSPTPVPS